MELVFVGVGGYVEVGVEGDGIVVVEFILVDCVVLGVDCYV